MVTVAPDDPVAIGVADAGEPYSLASDGAGELAGLAVAFEPYAPVADDGAVGLAVSAAEDVAGDEVEATVEAGVAALAAFALDEPALEPEYELLPQATPISTSSEMALNKRNPRRGLRELRPEAVHIEHRSLSRQQYE